MRLCSYLLLVHDQNLQLTLTCIKTIFPKFKNKIVYILVFLLSLENTVLKNCQSHFSNKNNPKFEELHRLVNQKQNACLKTEPVIKLLSTPGNNTLAYRQPGDRRTEVRRLFSRKPDKVFVTLQRWKRMLRGRPG